MIHDPQDWDDPSIFGRHHGTIRGARCYDPVAHEPVEPVVPPPSRWHKRAVWAFAILSCIAVWIGLLYGLLWVVGDL